MHSRLISGAAATLLALALTALPVVPDLAQGELADAAAHAKGPGGGNGGGPGGGPGGGNGAGNGGGKGGKGGKAGVGHTSGLGLGHAKGHGLGHGLGHGPGQGHGHDHAQGPGHDPDAVSGVGLGGQKSAAAHETATSQGLTASSLGRLNAAHANENALANAAPHSAVGLVAQFSEAEQEAIEAALAGDEEALNQAIAEAAEALAAAANKDIDEDVVGAVNDLLGIDTQNTGIEADIAAAASEAQASETNQGLGGFKDSVDGHVDASDADDNLDE